MNDEQRDLTPEEKRAIRALQRLAKTWPKSLWLFSGSGTLWVMKYDEHGSRVLDGTGADSKYIVDKVNIDNDGGDW